MSVFDIVRESKSMAQRKKGKKVVFPTYIFSSSTGAPSERKRKTEDSKSIFFLRKLLFQQKREGDKLCRQGDHAVGLDAKRAREKKKEDIKQISAKKTSLFSAYLEVTFSYFF